MYVLKNMTLSEKDYYTSQPTAEKLLAKTRRDADYIPPGDKTAAAVYVASRDAEKAAQNGNDGDTAQISKAGCALQQQAAKKSGYALTVTAATDSSNKMTVHFDNSAKLNTAVKKGFIEINGTEFLLSDDDKKRLLARDEQVRKLQAGIAEKNMLMQNAASAAQQSDAMREAGAKQSRIMMTALRIMHGKKVSPADEKELLEADHDLYSLAKSAAMLEEHRHKRDKDDERISEENEKARQAESEPKDYTAPQLDIPAYEVQFDVDVENADMPDAQ